MRNSLYQASGWEVCHVQDGQSWALTFNFWLSLSFKWTSGWLWNTTLWHACSVKNTPSHSFRFVRITPRCLLNESIISDSSHRVFLVSEREVGRGVFLGKQPTESNAFRQQCVCVCVWEWVCIVGKPADLVGWERGCIKGGAQCISSLSSSSSSLCLASVSVAWK